MFTKSALAPVTGCVLTYHQGSANLSLLRGRTTTHQRMNSLHRLPSNCPASIPLPRVLGLLDARMDHFQRLEVGSEGGGESRVRFDLVDVRRVPARCRGVEEPEGGESRWLFLVRDLSHPSSVWKLRGAWEGGLTSECHTLDVNRSENS